MILRLSLSKPDIKRITTQVEKATFKDFNSTIVEKFGSVHGHLGESVNEALQLWIRVERGEIHVVAK